MKIKVKLPKPRNPVVAPSQRRHAGAHGSYNSARRARRARKQALYLFLSGRKQDDQGDV